MLAELLQFAGVGVVFLVVVLLWLRIIYLPARTVERWTGDRTRDRRDHERPGRPGSF